MCSLLAQELAVATAAEDFDTCAALSKDLEDRVRKFDDREAKKR